MTGRNRVAPTGDLEAVAVRGSLMGNRGILHTGTDSSAVIARGWAAPAWICCVLSFKGWSTRQWADGHYTVLFFLDEAVALAAGHRPCALCRRDAYRSYLAAAGLTGLPAKDLDRRLHAERLLPGRAGAVAEPWVLAPRRRLHPMDWAVVPAGAFVVIDGRPHAVGDDGLRPWREHTYGDPIPLPTTGPAEVLTPPTSVTALRNGYPIAG